MKKKFSLVRDEFSYAEAIRYGRKQWVGLLVTGATLNEHYVEWIVRRLNGADEEPPPLPKK